MIASSEPTAILVFGMHRSGTSALARVLNLLGAEIGGGLIPANASNVSGHWENEAIVALHDRILAEFGRQWDSLALMPEDWQDTDIARRATLDLAAELERQFDGAPLIVVKDPRLSLLAPIWLRALEAVGRRPVFALAIRHPAEAAASLAMRDQLTRTHALSLWLRYLADSEAHSRGHPRVFVDYARLLENWRGEAARLASALGLSWRKPARAVAAAVDAFLDPGLQHHRALGDRPTVKETLESELAGIYFAARSAAMDETGAEERLHEMLRMSRSPSVLWRALADSETSRAYASFSADAETLHTNVAIYFSGDARPFDETHRIVTALPIDDAWHAVSLRVSSESLVTRLRLDVADRPGVYRIRHVAITADQRELAFDSARAFLDVINTARGIATECEEAGAIQVLTLGADPLLELQLPEWLHAKKLRISFGWRGVARLRMLFGDMGSGITEQIEAAIDPARHAPGADGAGADVAAADPHADVGGRLSRLASEREHDAAVLLRLGEHSATTVEALELQRREIEAVKGSQAAATVALDGLQARQAERDATMDRRLVEIRESLSAALGDFAQRTGKEIAAQARDSDRRVRADRESDMRGLRELLERHAEARASEQREHVHAVEQSISASRLDTERLADAWRQQQAQIAGAGDDMAALRQEVGQLSGQIGVLTGRLDRVDARTWSARLRRFLTGIPGALMRPFRARWLQCRLDYLRRYRFVVDRTQDLAPLDLGVWEVRGEDPQVLTRNVRRHSPSAGWYTVAFDFRLDGSTGLYRPGIYADYGAGMSESTFISLPMSGPTLRREILCRFAGDVRGIRFDPTTHGAVRFAFGGMSLRKLTRIEAAVRLLSERFAAQMRTPGGVSVLLRETWRTWRAEGFRGVLARLTAREITDSDDARYAHWVEQHDTIDDAQRADLRTQIDQLAVNPLISILLPVYNTPECWLRRCIESVLSQIYPHWELCIADDASTSTRTREILAEYAADDPRIKVTYRPVNGHISAASNSALELVTGDYVALLDHDDELCEHALAHVALALQAQPQARLLYSDEDKIDTQGRRYAPYFKPGWNPELLLSQNYLCHLVVIERSLLTQTGGFRVGFEGSQDHDLVLRCTQRIAPSAIVHIARVLYHWRAIGGSTAMSADQKSYTQAAGLRAVQQHLDRAEPGARVEAAAGGHYRVRYPLPIIPPLVSLIIPTRDKVSFLATCIRSILEKTTYPNYEIVVVDNQSSEPETLEYFAQIRADGRVRIVRYDAPFNYSAINNLGAASARGSVIGLINNDIEVISVDWLDEMVGHAIRPHVGVVGAMLYYPNDTIQHAGVIVGIGGIAGHAYLNRPRGFAGQMNRARLAQNLSAVTAACMILRKSVFEEVGGLDEAIKVAFNDIDFCLRVLRKGYINVWTPFAELYHHESVTRGYEDSPDKRQRFNAEIAFMQKRWGSELLRDPAYNPNLPLDAEPFTMPVRGSRSNSFPDECATGAVQFAGGPRA